MKFNPPNRNKQIEAIGSFRNTDAAIVKAFEYNSQHFSDMPRPGPDDWLSCHHEIGQSFENFSMKCKFPTKRQKFYILPIGANFDENILRKLHEFATLFFPGIAFEVKSPIKLSSLKVEKRMHFGQEQYSGGQILKSIQRKMPADAYAMIAVTQKDIYHSKEGNFVFGLANGQSKTGVFSFARYDNRFYGENEDMPLLELRAAKVMIHEMCHMFGLSHCIYFKCLMNGSNHIGETDSKSFLLCSVCARKIQFLLKFNVLEWYRGIFSALERQGGYFLQYMEWYMMRIEYLSHS